MPTPGPIVPLLAQAQAALGSRQPELALAPLLRAWTAARAPELAAIIDELSARLAGDRPPIAGATRAEIEQAWRARAERADAIELGVLLPSLVDVDSHQARRRLKLLARHAPDPRVAAALTSIVLSPPFTASSTAKFWKTLHELLCACPDPRSVERLEQAPPLPPNVSSTVERLDALRRRSLDNLRAQLEGLRISLTADELALVEAIAASFEAIEAASPDRGPELLAAIVENPAELELRSIYADYLQATGDPRGEFIALSLADGRGELDRAGLARARALQAEYGLTWLGPVARALVRGRIEFRNGFLATARIKSNHRGLEALLDDPVWATVELLEHAPLRLACAPIMRSVRELRWTSTQLIAAAREPELTLARVEALSVEGNSWTTHWVGLGGAEEHVRSAVEQPSLFPSLRRLRLELDALVELQQLAWTWSGPLGERLRELEIEIDGDRPLGLAAALRGLRRARSGPGLVRVDVANRVLGARFERVAGAWARVELRARPDARAAEIVEHVAALRELDELEITLDRRLIALGVA